MKRSRRRRRGSSWVAWWFVSPGGVGTASVDGLGCNGGGSLAGLGGGSNGIGGGAKWAKWW